MIDARPGEKGKILTISVSLFFIGLLLTAYSAKNENTTRLGASAVQTFVAPFEEGISTVRRFFQRSLDRYILLVNVKQENRELEQTVSLLSEKLVRLPELEFENTELRRILALKERLKLEGMVAHVIAYDTLGGARSLTLDLGRRDGVRVEQPVVRPEGVVGRIRSTTLTSSQVLLLTDYASGVDALVQPSRARGVLFGRGPESTRLEFVVPDDEVHVGDAVITSGMGGVYPKGLMLGSVTRVVKQPGELFQDIDVKPSADFLHLEQVLVVTE